MIDKKMVISLVIALIVFAILSKMVIEPLMSRLPDFFEADTN
jgi:hypothetical protein